MNKTIELVDYSIQHVHISHGNYSYHKAKYRSIYKQYECVNVTCKLMLVNKLDNFPIHFQSAELNLCPILSY